MNAQAFDPLQVELSGTHLIEASAGTGKTWTIAALVMRLLLERGLSLESILVVTFSEASTDELRGRIRQRLIAARDFLAGDDHAADDFLRRLLVVCGDDTLARARIETALAWLDEAAIHTIHGFCHRVLHEHALACGRAFEVTLQADMRALLAECVNDWWREVTPDLSPLLADHVAADERFRPAALAHALRPWIERSWIPLVPPPRPDAASLVQYESAYRHARQVWEQDGLAAARATFAFAGLSRTQYRETSCIRWLEQCSAWFRQPVVQASPPEGVQRLARDKLQDALKKGAGNLPEYPIQQTCQNLIDAWGVCQPVLQLQLAAMRHDLVQSARRGLAQRKHTLGWSSFDDLLRDLAQALDGAHGPALVAAVRQRYQAALIDEFQDTDALQYHIIRTVWHQAETPLFLVGDPKQSIYAFRNADPYAYLAARSEARGHTLETNRRASPGMVRALNAIFERHPQPFLPVEIGFPPARAAGAIDQVLELDGVVVPALTIWPLANGASIKSGVAGVTAAQLTARTIAGLLDRGAHGRAWLVDRAAGSRRPLLARDIAVLVRRNKQAAEQRAALLEHGVPCVLYGGGNVLLSDEAAQLVQVLAALSAPGRDDLVRAALATPLLGWTARQLDAPEPTAWLDAQDVFQRAAGLCRRSGPVPALWLIWQDYRVTQRLLQFPDGERRITNLDHLADLIGAATIEASDPSALLRWFVDARSDPQAAEKTQQFRVESDAQRVQVVTGHHAKGLEYPLVFIPYLWSGAGGGGAEPPAIERRDEGQRLLVDFDPSAATRYADALRQESLGEELRLAYVALTRAKAAAWVCWAATEAAASGPIAWLLHGPGHGPAELEQVRQRFATSKVDVLMGDLRELCAAAPGDIVLQAPTQDAQAPHTRAPDQAEAALPPTPGPRQVKSMPRDGGRVGSFSALLAGTHGESADYDQDALAGVDLLSPERDRHGFARGALAGRCLHQILERCDFAIADRAHLQPLVADALKMHGFEAVWLDMTVEWMLEVIGSPLGGVHRPMLRLRDVDAAHKLVEWEFTLAAPELTTATLVSLLDAAGLDSAWCAALRARELRLPDGTDFLKGFVDLVFEFDGRFFIADYKSNWLGPGHTDYGVDAVATSMGENLYFLQALIYAAAWCRHHRRLHRGAASESSFGGVYYLYLRGMRAVGPVGIGVHAWNPGPALIAAVERWLDGARR